MLPSTASLLYADQLYSAQRLKDRLKKEIDELRHHLAMLESGQQSDGAVEWIAREPQGIERRAELHKKTTETGLPVMDVNKVVSIYRNMITQRQKLYRSII